MDKRTILAFALSFIVLLLWSLLFAPKPEQKPAPEAPPAAQAPVAVKPSSPEEAPQPQKSPAAQPREVEVAEEKLPGGDKKEIKIDTALYTAVFSNLGPTVKSFRLKEYRQSTEPTSPLIEMVNLNGKVGDLLHFDFLNPAMPPNDRIAYAASAEYLTLKSGDAPAELRFSGKRENGLVIEKIFRFYPDQYKIDLQIEAQNRSAGIRSGAFTANVRALPPKEKKSYYSYVGLVLLLDDELEEVELEDPGEEKNMAGQIQWMAYEDDYFLSAIVPRDSKRGNFVGRRLSSGALDGTYLPETVSLNPHEKTSARFALYLGPRDLGALKQMGENLDRAVYFGWTTVIARPLLYVLRFFNQYLHNYGISIILLTILVKILFWPLTHKSYKSMSKMKKLQPHMTKIKEKYKNNREQMNKEMMALYKTYKVNPMGGCLPMVIQIPVFFALFRILGSSIELRHAPFILWIDDLSAPDRLFNFPFEIPFMAAPYGIPVLTLLMGASMFLQQKMTPTPGDPAQAKIMMFLPLIFTFVFINFPAGLVLYWLVNNVLSIAQQYRIQKKTT